MKKLFFCIVISFIGNVFAQQKNYFPIWTYHQKNVNIHGISVGAFTEQENNSLTNGIKIEAIGLGIFFLVVK